MPAMPTAIPITVNRKSSKIIAKAIITTPRDGSVSSPENGGARNAKIVKNRIVRASILVDTTLTNNLLNRGFEWPSTQRTDLNSLGRAEVCNLFGNFLFVHCLGSQTVFLPAINSRDNSITI